MNTLSDPRNPYAEPHPGLLIPTSPTRRAPAPELLAQLVAVLLLLVAWVLIVWAVSTGLLSPPDGVDPAVPVRIERPSYLTA